MVRQGDGVFLMDGEHGHERVVLEAGGGLRLAQETFAGFGQRGQLAGEDFDRDAAVELGVVGGVDGAGGAAAEDAL